jgi:hypothetical protein
MSRHAELHVQHVEGSTTPETDEPTGIVELGNVHIMIRPGGT